MRKILNFIKENWFFVLWGSLIFLFFILAIAIPSDNGDGLFESLAKGIGRLAGKVAEGFNEVNKK